MKQNILAILSLLLIFTLVAPASAIPTRALGLDPAEPPPPVSPAPTPIQPGVGEQLIPPVPGEIANGTEQDRARQAMETALAKYLAYWGPHYQMEISKIVVDGDWAVGLAEWQSEAKIFDDPLQILAHRLPDGSWQTGMSNEGDVYSQLLDIIPESLHDEITTEHQFASTETQIYMSVERNITIITGTVVVESSIDIAVQEALVNANEVLSPVSDYYAITDLSYFDQWLFVSVIGLAGISSDLSWNLLDNGTWFGLVLLKADRDGNWSGALEGTDEFSQILYEIPSNILEDDTKLNLDPLTRAEIPLSGYIFPWQTGKSMKYGSLGVHDNGFPGVVTGWKAVDFVSDGDTGAGHAPNQLLASASGTINYKCTPGAGQNSTAIRIGDLMYTHMVNDGNLYVGRYFSQGETMGMMKAGSFSENCGYADQSAQSFHVHWGFPNTGSLQAGGWTLTFADQTWRRGGETRVPGQWMLAEGGTSCSGPSLISPIDGQVMTSRTVTFSWNSVSGCTFNGYTFRVKNVPDMDSGGTTIIDTGEGGTSRTETFASQWDNQDLYWGVKAANAPSGAAWSVRRFRIEPYVPPQCNPNSDQIALYADTGFGGACVTLGIGEYPSPGNLGSVGNDNAESIRVGGNVQVILYEHDYYNGRSEIFTGEDSNLSDNYIGANSVSSVKVQSRTQIPATPTLSMPGNGSNYGEGTTFNLVWNTASSASEYYAEYWGGPAGTISSGWQGGTSWYIGSQWAGYTYSWHVKARNGSGESSWSDTWTFTVRPYAPSSLSGQASSCSQVNLYWADNSGNEEGYKIYRNDSYVGWAGVNSTFYQDAGLSENTTYSYYVKAYRGSIESDASNTIYVTTPTCTPPMPDLRPYAPLGYAYPVVPSSVLGTHQVNTLVAGQTTYFDWYFTNSGNATAWGNFYVELRIDGVWFIRYPYSDWYAGYHTGFDDWAQSVSSPGWHTIAMVVDPDNTIVESDEGNNTWEMLFYWTTSAPYYDDMENGTSDWTASGLWHQVDSGNPYVAYHSPTHSWWYGQDATGNYDTGTANSGDLVSPLIYIPSSEAVLEQMPSSAYPEPQEPISNTLDIPLGNNRFRQPVALISASEPPANVTAENANILGDGGFEAGTPNTYWSEYSSNFGTPLCSVATCGFGNGYSGDWWVWFGGISGVVETGYVDQSVIIPSGTATLSFWLAIPSAGVPGFMNVSMDGNVLFSVTEADASSYTSYQQVVLDISLYADGGMHTLRFSSTTESGDSSTSFFVDDVVLDSIMPFYLRFWYRYQTETQGQDWDQRWVQLSVDGGPFENLLQLSDDPMNIWLQSPAIDLSAYTGHVIQIRFHFDTLDNYSNDYRGWYIDDISISTAPPPSCADPYEANNNPAQATDIAYGESMMADICPQGDLDFYAITGMAGDRIVVDIDAKVDGSWLDSYIYLLSDDGESVLSLHDDEVGSTDSKLGYTLPYSGMYYVKVRAWNHPSVGGEDYFYTIHLYTDEANPNIAQIISPVNDAWLNPTLQTITVDAEDNTSGTYRVEFLWHDADWGGSDWISLGSDNNGADGWSWNFDTSILSEQRGSAFYIWAFDWVGNWSGDGAWNLGIDRTPPTVSTYTERVYGDAPFIDFRVWWSGTDNLSSITTYDVQYRDGSGGTWINLVSNTQTTYDNFVGKAGHTYYFRTRARDIAGNVSVYAGGAGDAQYLVVVCPTSADSYEADNSYTNARPISLQGIPQIHNFHIDGDQDWVKFNGVAGITYTLETTNNGGYADTQLMLYDSDGSTVLEYNDDYPGLGWASRIDWQPSSSGVYYLKVSHWDPWAYGCVTEYSISVLANQELYQVFLTLITR